MQQLSHFVHYINNIIIKSVSLYENDGEIDPNDPDTPQIPYNYLDNLPILIGSDGVTAYFSTQYSTLRTNDFVDPAKIYVDNDTLFSRGEFNFTLPPNNDRIQTDEVYRISNIPENTTYSLIFLPDDHITFNENYEGEINDGFLDFVSPVSGQYKIRFENPAFLPRVVQLGVFRPIPDFGDPNE